VSVPRSLGALVLALGLAAPAAHATMMVKPMTLDEVTAESKHVVHGVVTSVVSDRDEHGVPSTWTTFEVAETLKGDSARTLTIKQYGVASPLPDGTLTRLSGMPRYEVGEEVVLFLRGASRRGFTSPVGLGQGTYRVRRGNGRAMPEVRGDAGAPAPRDLATFVAKVRGTARAQEAK
jgi:hypothetical protein